MLIQQMNYISVQIIVIQRCDLMDKITIPNPEDGLSDSQRDMLLVGMGNGINHLCLSVDRINGDVEGIKKEIYGEEEYQGVKSTAEEAKRESYKNSRWITWLVRILVISGALTGIYGIPQVVGG